MNKNNQFDRESETQQKDFAPMDEYTLLGDGAELAENVPAEKGLKEQVGELLYLHPEFDDRNVHVAVTDGTITLMGRVETQMDKSLAESLVMELDGVVNVINLLEVDASDTWMNTPERENFTKGLY